jgi:heme exporter protein B
MSKIRPLLTRFFQQELRNSNALFSLGLYLLGITYLIYLLGGNNAADSTWNTLLWVVVFFGTVSQASRSFDFESGDYFFYFQTLIGPGPTIIAKLAFNAAYMSVLSFLTWGLFSVFYGNTVFSPILFAAGLLLGCIGFSVVLTLTNGIAHRTNGNATLSTVLAIPLLFPVLKLTSALNVQAMVGVPLIDVLDLLGALAALDIAIGLLAYLLFPYLWQD